MNTLLEAAFEKVRALPQDQQAVIADIILDYTSADHRPQLNDEQVAEVERRMAAPDRTFVSLTDVRRRLRRFGV